MNSCRIAVVGTINRDIIISDKGARTESLGGILYNVLALAELGYPLLTVTPVTFIGSDARAQLFGTLECLKGVSLDGITGLAGRTNTNRLTYLNKNDRKEMAAFNTPAIPFEKIAPFLDVDILLFNFIAGYDVSLETLQRVKQGTGALVFIDVHSMVLKQEVNAERRFGPVHGWQTWAAQADMMQMNTGELLYFTGHANRTLQDAPATISRLIKELLRLGPRLIIVTAGSRGVYLGMKRNIHFLPQRYRAPAIDTTGCGDIFSAAFLTKLLVSGDPFIACDYANSLSGFATREEGIKKCFSLKHSSPLFKIPPSSTPIKTRLFD